MEAIDIVIVISVLLLVLVVLGMRVGFAAALAGLVGLIWIFWAKKGYDSSEFLWALGVAVKTAGQVPHSKISSQALSLIPTFILIGFLAYHAGLTQALFETAKRWIGCLAVLLYQLCLRVQVLRPSPGCLLQLLQFLPGLLFRKC